MAAAKRGPPEGYTFRVEVRQLAHKRQGRAPVFQSQGGVDKVARLSFTAAEITVVKGEDGAEEYVTVLQDQRQSLRLKYRELLVNTRNKYRLKY